MDRLDRSADGCSIEVRDKRLVSTLSRSVELTDRIAQTPTMTELTLDINHQKFSSASNEQSKIVHPASTTKQQPVTYTWTLSDDDSESDGAADSPVIRRPVQYKIPPWKQSLISGCKPNTNVSDDKENRRHCTGTKYSDSHKRVFGKNGQTISDVKPVPKKPSPENVTSEKRWESHLHKQSAAVVRCVQENCLTQINESSEPLGSSPDLLPVCHAYVPSSSTATNVSEPVSLCEASNNQMFPNKTDIDFSEVADDVNGVPKAILPERASASCNLSHSVSDAEVEFATTGKKSLTVVDTASQTDLPSMRSCCIQTDKSSNSPAPRDRDHRQQQQLTVDLARVVVNKKEFLVLGKIGSGGFSKVEKVFEPSGGKIMALKTVALSSLTPMAQECCRKEIRLLQKMQFSDKVVRLYDFEHVESENKVLMLLECGETDLAAFLKKRLSQGSLDPYLRRVYWKAMLQAVEDLHSQGIIHSDIKPANFLLVSGEVKLIDFGIANQLDTDMTSMRLEMCMGTLNYMAPEVVNNAASPEGNLRIGRKADVWSLGCLLYYMTYGHTPFQHIVNMAVKLGAITSESSPIAYADVGEPHLKDTLQLCLQRDPKKRADIEQLLLHAYLK